MSLGATLGRCVCGCYLKVACLWALLSGSVSVGVTLGRCVYGCYIRVVCLLVLP